MYEKGFVNSINLPVITITLCLWIKAVANLLNWFLSLVFDSLLSFTMKKGLSEIFLCLNDVPVTRERIFRGISCLNKVAWNVQ